MASRARRDAAVAASGVCSVSSGLSGPRFFAEDLFLAAPAVAATMPNKKVIFNLMPDMVFVFESGADEFTFDNTWPDGSPKTSFHKKRLSHP